MGARLMGQSAPPSLPVVVNVKLCTLKPSKDRMGNSWSIHRFIDHYCADVVGLTSP